MTPHESDDEGAARGASQVGQRVVWNRVKGEFDIQVAPESLPAMEAEPQAFASLYPGTNVKGDGADPFSSSSLETALSRFEVDQLRSEARFDDFQTARSKLQQRILSSDAPMRWLPGFVAKWSSQLAFFSEKVTTTAASPADQSLAAALADEFLELAHTLQFMGEIQQARGHLGRCIALVRRSQSTVIEAKEPAALVLEDAKKALFACIKFQESLAKCHHLLLRAKTPPQILAFLVREVELLSSQAPFFTQLLRIKTDLQWKTHQYAAIVSSLSASSLTRMDAHLMLLYARALETQGMYQQSLTIASQWLTDKNEVSTSSDDVGGDQDDLTARLVHKDRLMMLLENKSSAEQLQREGNFEEASRCYSQCLKLLDSTSNRSFHASLLLNRANMTLMHVGTYTTTAEATRLSSAIDDLTLSLKLNPSNQLTRLRLDTALLQLETQKLKSRMKMVK